MDTNTNSLNQTINRFEHNVQMGTRMDFNINLDVDAFAICPISSELVGKSKYDGDTTYVDDLNQCITELLKKVIISGELERHHQRVAKSNITLERKIEIDKINVARIEQGSNFDSEQHRLSGSESEEMSDWSELSSEVSGSEFDESENQNDSVVDLPQHLVNLNLMKQKTQTLMYTPNKDQRLDTQESAKSSQRPTKKYSDSNDLDSQLQSRQQSKSKTYKSRKQRIIPPPFNPLRTLALLLQGRCQERKRLEEERITRMRIATEEEEERKYQEMKLAKQKLNFWGFGSVIKKHSQKNVISNITSARSSVGSDGKEYDAFLDRENLVTNIRIKKPSRKKSKNFSPTSRSSGKLR